MANRCGWAIGIAMLALGVGCGGGGGGPKHAALEPCSSEWMADVERRIQTGDAEGHGPDVGSFEWKSVVEFKLGIRYDASVPDPSSAEWCDYIDASMSERGL